MEKIYLGGVVVLLSFLIIYVICQLNSPDLDNYISKHREQINWVSINDILDNAGNGDLIFLSGNTKGEKTCKWCTNTMYSHVGFLFRENHPDTGEDLLYIWDSDLGQKTKEGPRVMLLKDKLKKYKGSKYISWKKFKGERPDTEDILKIVNKYGKLKFDDKILSWWVSNDNTVSNFLYKLIKNNNEVFCSELIAMTLQDLNILDRTKKSAWYSPGDFVTYKIQGLTNGNSYSSVYMADFSGDW